MANGSEALGLGSDIAGGAASGSALGPWGAAIGAGVGLLKGAYGIAQQNKAKKLAAQNKRPTYNIPEEISQNLSDAQRMALEGLPDEQKAQFVSNIQRSQQFGLQGLSDRKAGIAGLGSIVQSGNDSYNNLLGQDAAARQRNQGILMNQRNQMAEYKDKAFGINQMEPYQQKAAAVRALTGAGTQNVFSGLTDIAQGALRLPKFGGMNNTGGIGAAPQYSGSNTNTGGSSQYYGLGMDDGTDQTWGK